MVLNLARFFPLANIWNFSRTYQEMCTQGESQFTESAHHSHVLQIPKPLFTLLPFPLVPNLHLGNKRVGSLHPLHITEPQYSYKKRGTLLVHLLVPAPGRRSDLAKRAVLDEPSCGSLHAVLWVVISGNCFRANRTPELERARRGRLDG